MWELVKAGGWVMLPIILCSVLAVAIVLERFWSLRRAYVAPNTLVADIWKVYQQGQLDGKTLELIRTGSPLGRILSAGLVNMHHSREIMKEAVEEVGRQVVHELERYLNTLGTVAAITPLLGLLGTVWGMIKTFSAITHVGLGNPTALAGGISEALITTAAGLTVAIPALMFHRYFTGLVDRYALHMEEEALRLIEVLQGEREKNDA